MNLKSLIRKPMKRRLFLCGIGFLIVGFIMIIVNMEDYNENILYKLLPSVLTIIISVLSSRILVLSLEKLIFFFLHIDSNIFF